MPNLTALIVVAAVMFCVLGGVTLLAHIYNLNNIKSKTVGDGQHGTARFSTKAEIRKVYRQGEMAQAGKAECAAKAAAGDHCRLSEQGR